MPERKKLFDRKSYGKRRIIIILLIIMALAAALLEISAAQRRKIRQTMNNAAYSNMESTLRSLSSMVSNTFAIDNRNLEALASTLSAAEDKQKWLDSLEYNLNNIEGVFYADEGDTVAAGKNGAELDLAEFTFSVHGDGQVRSNAFLTVYGSYAYLGRADVTKDGKTAGYLYVEYPMSRFKKIMPQDAANGNDVSMMDSKTMDFVYVPAVASSGIYVNYQQLSHYLKDPSQAPAIIEEIEAAVGKGQYYMRILTFAQIVNHKMSDVDYVVYLWPVDDGEYYITGFTKVDHLQSERIQVERTVGGMIWLLIGTCAAVMALIGVCFGNAALSNRRKALLQQQHTEELDEALQIARAANESKSNFLSNMSHDIRTPMNAIIGYTTLIDKDADSPDKVREYTRKISGAGDYLLSLINDVLDMSKIESGKTKLNISQFSIREMVNEVESIIRMQAEHNQQEFTVCVDGVAHECVLGDAMRIRQIALNLLSNALKYTPAGGKIRFSVVGVPQEKANIQKLRLVVQDTGYGMDAEYVKTIFEPFTRLDNSMTGKIQGTGLGLAITKNIVDLMGGTIVVNSIPGKGSTFTVELELPVSEGAELIPEGATAETDNAPFSLNGLHILAAEDNELNAEILKALLTMEGADCVICEDGQKIVDAFVGAKPGTYDLILMDIQMPNVNGYEATKTIRASAHPEAKSIPIVAMTANAFAEDVLNARQAGMDGHISKPVDMNTMKKTIGQVLKNRKKDITQ